MKNRYNDVIAEKIIEHIKQNNLDSIQTTNLAAELDLSKDLNELMAETLTVLYDDGIITGIDVIKNSGTGKNLVVGIVKPKIT